jgi:Protein of unknown function (DUF1524)
LDLSYADILKAEIIGQVPTNAQQPYTEKWEGVEEELGRIGFEELLRHILMLTAKRILKESILEEFRATVIKQYQQNTQRLIDKALVPYSAAYVTIRDEDFRHTRGAEPVNNSLRWLNRIPDSDWMPSAMLYLARRRDDPERLSKFLADLERLAVMLVLRRTSASKRVTRYSAVLDAIENGNNLAGPTSPLQPADEERREALQILSGPIYRHSARVRTYVLLRLDAFLAQGDATYNYPIVSIEHVLPQKVSAGSEWSRWFPTQELRDQWTHRLGNLVLLSRRKNSAAANYDC